MGHSQKITPEDMKRLQKLYYELIWLEDWQTGSARNIRFSAGGVLWKMEYTA